MRWWIGVIALKTWVPTSAPASSARATIASSAAVCPTATRTPAATKRRTASSPPGSSGARVTIRRAPRPASTSRSTVAGVGRAQQVGLVGAGLLEAERKGPSRCTPARWPSSTRSASTSELSARSSSEAGDQAGEGRRRAVAGVEVPGGQDLVGVAAGVVVPAAAVHVGVDEAGDDPAAEAFGALVAVVGVHRGDPRRRGPPRRRRRGPRPGSRRARPGTVGRRRSPGQAKRRRRRGADGAPAAPGRARRTGSVARTGLPWPDTTRGPTWLTS